MPNLEFIIDHRNDKYCHIGTLKTWNGKKISTPVMWFGLSVIESPQFVFKAFKQSKVEAFLSNVYDLKYQDKKGERFQLIKDLVNEGLFHKMDSGGFQLMKSFMILSQKINSKLKTNSSNKIKEIDITQIFKSSLNPLRELNIINQLNCSNKLKDLTQQDVYNLQLEIEPDVSIPLDFPLNPFLNSIEQKALIDWTIRNYEFLLSQNQINDKKISVLPVIHGYSTKYLDYGIKQIRNLYKKYNLTDGSIPAIGIGSLVPMAKSISGSGKIGSRWNLFNLLLELRERLPNTFIHAFGIGGTTAYLAFMCGVDSLDSTGWIQKTAYGTIQLPGISDRFLEPKTHNRPYLINNRHLNGQIINEIDMFMKCKCNVCWNYFNNNWTENDWKKKQEDFRQYTTESKLKRVIHNLSLYQSEINEFRKAILENSFHSYIFERIKNSNFLEEYNFILNWKQGNKKSIKNKLNQSNITDFI